MTHLEPPTSRPSTSGAAPVSLHDIARRAAGLWSVEPQVPQPRRAELLGELHDLEFDLDTLVLRAAAGIDVHPTQVRRCAQRYLWLRQEWGDHGIAA